MHLELTVLNAHVCQHSVWGVICNRFLHRALTLHSALMSPSIVSTYQSDTSPVLCRIEWNMTGLVCYRRAVCIDQ